MIPVWNGQTCTILGSGPSLNRSDINYALKLGMVIAVNDSYLLCPEADIFYGCDLKWWRWTNLEGVTHYDAIKVLPGRRFTASKDVVAIYPDIEYIIGQHGDGFCLNYGVINYGHNGGFQAINIAIHTGCTKILLLGFDMRIHSNATDATYGASHFFGEHPDKCRSPYNLFIGAFKAACSPIPIINCTPNSALKCFPFYEIKALYEQRS